MACIKKNIHIACLARVDVCVLASSCGLVMLSYVRFIGFASKSRPEICKFPLVFDVFCLVFG